MRTAKMSVVLCLTLLVAIVTAQQSSPIMFEGARLIIGDGRVIESGALVIDNGHITTIGRMGQVQRPSGAVRVDVTGKTIMPTLIDAHMHMGYENMSSWQADNYTRANVIDTLNRLAYYGVGAVISTGTDPVGLAFQLQKEQDAGNIGGARFLFAAGFAPPGQGPNPQVLKELPKFPEVVVHGITNDADARQALRDVKAQSVAFVKVWVTDRGGTQQKTTPEAYRALIDEAHKNRIVTLAHATDNLEDAKDLARAGLDGFIHGVLDADAEFAAMVKKNNGFITPAQGLGNRNLPGQQHAWYEDPSFLEATPPATIERYRRQTANAPPAAANTPTPEERLRRPAQMIKVLQAGGVRIAVGTDSGALPDYPPGFPVHREMEIYTKMGMTPDQVIVAATKSGAEALRLDKELGTLEAGKVANLLILNADPRTDITNTRKIASVYIQGKPIDRAAMRKKWNPAATATK